MWMFLFAKLIKWEESDNGSFKNNQKKKGKAAQKQQPASNRFQTEILILVVLAACIILMISAFGMGGIVGNAISSITFGIMGMCAYLFPVVLFSGVSFLLVNSSSRLAYKKFLAGIVFFIFLCGLAASDRRLYTKCNIC